MGDGGLNVLAFAPLREVVGQHMYGIVDHQPDTDAEQHHNERVERADQQTPESEHDRGRQ